MLQKYHSTLIILLQTFFSSATFNKYFENLLMIERSMNIIHRMRIRHTTNNNRYFVYF